MKLRWIAISSLVIASLPSFAQETAAPWDTFSVFAGFETTSVPPVDFGALSTFVDLSVPLSSLFDSLEIGLHMRWQMTSSMFHIQTVPVVETFALDAAIPLLVRPMIDIGPFVGISAIVNRATATAGVAFDLGIRGSF